MAVEIITGASLTINSVDVSAWVESFTLTQTGTDGSYQTFGSDWTQQAAGGTKSGSLQINWKQDYAASAVDVSINGLLNTVVTFVAKKSSASTGPTNPAYSGSVKVTEYVPLNPAHSQVHSFSTTWPTSGTIARATT